MVTSMSDMKKGQYFSFDAIVASVIFILAITLLSGHWYSLRAQIDDRSDYLYSEAFRISDTLLGPGDPLRPLPWYMDPLHATRAGLAVNGSLPVELDNTTLTDIAYYLNPSNRQYNDSKVLLGTGAEYWVEINTTYARQDFSRGGPQGVWIGNYTFGQRMVNPTEVAHVSREIVVQTVNTPGQIHYFPGTLTVYVWSNKTRS